MPRLLTTALCALVLAASSAHAMILVKIPNIGDCSVATRDVAARGAGDRVPRHRARHLLPEVQARSLLHQELVEFG